MSKRVNEIFKTYDYGKFTILHGNRALSPSHAAALAEYKSEALLQKQQHDHVLVRQQSKAEIKLQSLQWHLRNPNRKLRQLKYHVATSSKPLPLWANWGNLGIISQLICQYLIPPRQLREVDELVRIFVMDSITETLQGNNLNNDEITCDKDERLRAGDDISF